MFFSIRGEAADQFQTHHGSSVARPEVAGGAEAAGADDETATTINVRMNAGAQLCSSLPDINFWTMGNKAK